MKLLRVEFGDDEMPVSADVRLTVTEMVLLYNLTGRTAPLFVTQAAGGDQQYGDANLDIAECLSGAFFNRYWDDGVNDAGPRFGVTEIAARKADHSG